MGDVSNEAGTRQGETAELELGHYKDSELVELSEEDAEGGTTPTVAVVTLIGGGALSGAVSALVSIEVAT
jgi:hypothetical protein